LSSLRSDGLGRQKPGLERLGLSGVLWCAVDRRGRAVALNCGYGFGVQRWPRRVYGVGTEPDPRFSLANERTFLAWLRTSLALMAAGVAFAALGPTGSVLELAVAVALLVTGIACSLSALQHWIACERALRTSRPLPAPWMAAVLGIGLAVTGVLACVLVLSK
jgi:putative membrane protein